MISIDEEPYWGQAYDEYEGEDRRKGLWAKLYASHNGDEHKIKIEYIKIRANQLIEVAKKR